MLKIDKFEVFSRCSIFNSIIVTQFYLVDILESHMRKVSDLIDVFKDIEIAGYFDCNYLFCIVVVEKNAAPTATYNLLVCVIFMILQFLLTILADWYLKRKYSGNY